MTIWRSSAPSFLTVCWRVVRPADGLIGGAGDAAAEDVQLDFDAQQGLENAVVEVAGDAAAFGFDGAGA